jgi:hypothetical protein
VRFFGRDQAATRKSLSADLESQHSVIRSEGGRTNQRIPKVESVIRKLFNQFADAVDASTSTREVIELISQIPTCVRAFAVVSERWHFENGAEQSLSTYLSKIAISVLAPGIASRLHRTGAVRRLSLKDRTELSGGPDFIMGVALLEVSILLEFSAALPERRRVLKDMHDVFEELQSPLAERVDDSAVELLVGSTAHCPRPSLEQLRLELKEVSGEMGTLNDRRAALRKLVELVNQGTRDRVQLMPLGQAATDNESAASTLIDVMLESGGRNQLVEINSEDSACPECYTVFPTALRNRLNNPTSVRRCGCGVLLVRSLEQ